MPDILTQPALTAGFLTSGWRRLLGRFVAGTALCLMLIQLPLVRHYLLSPLTVFLARLISSLLGILGEPVSQIGPLISGPAINLQITPACTGIYQIVFLCLAMLSWPAAGRVRLSGMISGTLFLTAINIIRIISIYYVALVVPSYVPFLHDIVWESLMILIVLASWLIWVRCLPPPGRKDP